MTKIEPLGGVRDRAPAALPEEDSAGRPGPGDRLVDREPTERFDSILATAGNNLEGDQ
ncbi:hypothetical protein [Streptomyces sp. SID12501]|uniref:Uncharacterized protein n=1 Tax=Streptomyces sp. SID12501 TaxID=2706042 RepID=A0A6B3BRR5_9ACTN|nr:hypothetical protein [Streptomyces sp. SID12501]NEC87033.1 hypothetical protein [Streptomyces sp. SID12501]